MGSPSTERNARTNAPISDPAEEVMGQFCFALGATAQMWIKRDAIMWFRQLYLEDIQTMVSTKDWETVIWKGEAPIDLEFCRMIGRRAAWIALSKGKTYIGLRSLDTAIQEIMNTYVKGRIGEGVLGPPCSTLIIRRRHYKIPRGASD